MSTVATVNSEQCDNHNRNYSTDVATTLSRMDLSGYVGHVTIFS